MVPIFQCYVHKNTYYQKKINREIHALEKGIQNFYTGNYTLTQSHGRNSYKHAATYQGMSVFKHVWKLTIKQKQTVH